MAAKRVRRLKELVELLERLPESPDRDRVLSEVRSRAVDVDTGVTPRGMRPAREAAPPPVLALPPKRETASSIARTPPPPAPVVEIARPAFATGPSKRNDAWLQMDERLSLADEAPLPHVPAQGGRVVPPWTLGLRA